MGRTLPWKLWVESCRLGRFLIGSHAIRSSPSNRIYEKPSNVHARRPELWQMRVLRVVATLIFIAGTSARAQELPPEVRARLFSPTQQVTLTEPIVRVAMRGADRAGNRKCPY